MRQPILPSEYQRLDPLQPWRRLATARAIAAVSGAEGETYTAVIQRLWGSDERAVAAIERAASTPASTTGWGSGLAGSAVGPFLKSMRARSAAAQLFATPLSLAARQTLLLPRLANDWTDPTFVVEGGPIPAVQGNFAGVTLGPPKKLAMIAAISGELRDYSAEDAETVMKELMDDAISRALDKAVFSATAASAARPAGLLNGVTAITAATGGGLAAMVADVKALVAAINTAGGGSSIILFAAPAQAVALNMLANNPGFTIVAAPSLADGTIVAVEANAIASGFDGLPRIDASHDVTVHFEDTTPAVIGAAGSPNVVAAPTVSAFQSDLLVLRIILPCAWVTRAPGMVQFVTGATW